MLDLTLILVNRHCCSVEHFVVQLCCCVVIMLLLGLILVTTAWKRVLQIFRKMSGNLSVPGWWSFCTRDSVDWCCSVIVNECFSGYSVMSYDMIFYSMLLHLAQFTVEYILLVHHLLCSRLSRPHYGPTRPSVRLCICPSVHSVL